jgi:hypothetical protein
MTSTCGGGIGQTGVGEGEHGNKRFDREGADVAIVDFQLATVTCHGRR